MNSVAVREVLKGSRILYGRQVPLPSRPLKPLECEVNRVLHGKPPHVMLAVIDSMK